MSFPSIMFFTEIKTEIHHTQVSSNNSEKLLLQHKKRKNYIQHDHQITTVLQVGPTENDKSHKPTFLLDFFQGSFNSAL